MFDLDLNADKDQQLVMTEQEQEVLAYATKVAQVMDHLLPIPGTHFRIGLDGILGLAPGIGDGVTALAPLSVIALSLKAGLPKTLLARMLGNVGVDLVIGTIPVVGDLADFGLKANGKNLRLLHRHFDLAEPEFGPPNRGGDRSRRP